MNSQKKAVARATVELTERALADLRQIERYSIEKWGQTTANQYLDDIAAAFDRIIENPEILSLEPDFAPGLYFYRVRKHVLVCDYNQPKVVVLTILHTNMDLPVRLAELELRLIAEAQILRSKLNR